jgi:hypothetical protein
LLTLLFLVLFPGLALLLLFSSRSCACFPLPRPHSPLPTLSPPLTNSCPVTCSFAPHLLFPPSSFLCLQAPPSSGLVGVPPAFLPPFLTFLSSPLRLHSCHLFLVLSAFRLSFLCTFGPLSLSFSLVYASPLSCLDSPSRPVR